MQEGKKEIFAITSNKKEASAPAVSTTTKIPIVSHLKTELPTFSGNPMEWSGLFTLFNSVIFKDTSLTDVENCCLLTKAPQKLMGLPQEPPRMQTTLILCLCCRQSTIRREQFTLLMSKPCCHRIGFLTGRKKWRRLQRSGCIMPKARESWRIHLLFMGALLIKNFDETLRQHWCVHTEGHKDPPTINIVTNFLQFPFRVTCTTRLLFLPTLDLPASIHPPSLEESQLPEEIQLPFMQGLIIIWLIGGRC